MNSANLDEILELSPTIFQNIQQNDDLNFPVEENIFPGNNVGDISFSNLNFSPDYCLDDSTQNDQPFDNNNEEEESKNYRRKSSRIEDQVRSKLAEKIRMENDRIEKEAMMLENENFDANADLDDSADDFGVVLSSSVKITLKPATQESSYEAVENCSQDVNSNHSTDTSKTQICDDSNEENYFIHSNNTSFTQNDTKDEVKGIKYQGFSEIKCFGLTCRKNVDLSKSLYCSSTCLRSYVNSIVESNKRMLKEKFGEKKLPVLLKTQKLVLLNRRTGEIYSGKQAPRARSEDLLKFLKAHLTCQVVRDKFSNQAAKKRLLEEPTKSESSKPIVQKTINKKEIYAACDETKDFFKKIFEKQIRESKSLLIINKKRLEEICCKLVDELKSCHSFVGNIEALKNHIVTLKEFFDPSSITKMASLCLDLILRGDISISDFISNSSSINQIQIYMKQFKSHSLLAGDSSKIIRQPKKSAIRDTTDQHGKHFFDTNCSICQNKSKPSLPAKDGKVKDDNSIKSTIEAVKESISKTIQIEKESLKPKSPEKIDKESRVDLPRIIDADQQQNLVETACAMINLNADNPCQINLESYAEACSDPGHELNMILSSFMKCTLYPVGNIRAPKLDQPETEKPDIPEVAQLPTFLRIIGGFNKRQLATFVQKHLSFENREVLTFLILPGTMSYIDERSLILYHRFLQNLVGRDSGGILANAEINSLADKFKDLLVYAGEELPFVLNVEAHSGTREELMRRGFYRYNTVNHLNHVKNSSLGNVKLYLILIRKKLTERRKQASLLLPLDVPETPAFENGIEDDDMEIEELPKIDLDTAKEPKLQSDPDPKPDSLAQDKGAISEAIKNIDIKRVLSTLSGVFANYKKDESLKDPSSINEKPKFTDEFERIKNNVDYSYHNDSNLSNETPDENYPKRDECQESTGNYLIHNNNNNNKYRGDPDSKHDYNDFRDVDLRNFEPPVRDIDRRYPPHPSHDMYPHRSYPHDDRDRSFHPNEPPYQNPYHHGNRGSFHPHDYYRERHEPYPRVHPSHRPPYFRDSYPYANRDYPEHSHPPVMQPPRRQYYHSNAGRNHDNERFPNRNNTRR